MKGLCKNHAYWQKQYSLSDDNYQKLKAAHDKQCILPLANKTRTIRKGP